MVSVTLLLDDENEHEEDEEDEEDNGDGEVYDGLDWDDEEDFDDNRPGPSGLGSVSGVNSGALGGTTDLCSHSFHSSYSAIGSLCPYSSSSPSPPPISSYPSPPPLSPYPSPPPFSPYPSPPPFSPYPSPPPLSPIVPVCSPPPAVRSRSDSPDRGRGKGRGKGRGRGPSPDTSASPDSPASPVRRRGRGRDRGRGRGGGGSSPPGSPAPPGGGRGGGRGRGRGRGRGCRDTPEPPTFPNCAYSFSNRPPFTGNSPGPTLTLRDPSAYNYFALFFDDQLVQHIVDQTNLYARLHPYRRANYQWHDTSVDEMRSFLGIFLATGLVCLPNLEDYWEVNSIFSQPGIVKGMSRNRFQQLCGRLHFNDNSLAPAYGTPGYDKLYKIRPVIDAICEKSKMWYNPGRDVSVDEAMVKFKGRSTLKQFQPLKPIKRGFKIWCRADSVTGYIDNFVVYTGKSDEGRTTNLGYKVVMEACRDILDQGYHVFCDNYFTSVHLAADLLEHGTTLVGTTRPDRTDFPCHPCMVT